MVADPTEHDHDRLLLLLGICEDFLTHTSPAAHREVDTLLHERGITGGPGWLIDMLAFTRLNLQRQRQASAPGTHHDA